MGKLITEHPDYSINQNEYKAKFWKGYTFRATFGGGMEVVPTGFW